MKAIPILLLEILLSFCGRAFAEDGAANPRQLNHRVFTATDGAPSDIRALAQTPDGMLWIGSLGGLTRFDGVRFTPYPSQGEEPLQSHNIGSLFVAPDGGLWIGFRPGGVALLKGGHVTHFGQRDGLPNGTVAQFAWDRDGSLWAATRVGLARLEGKRWEKVVDDASLGTPYGVLVDRAGTLWVATLNGLFARAAGESRFRAVDNRVYSSSQWIPITSAPDGNLWAAPDDRDLVRVDRPVDPQRDRVVTVRATSGGPLLVDSEGSLWVANMAAASLRRVPFRDLTVAQDTSEIVVRPEKPSRRDELNSVRVFSLLEDRERNIWVGTDTGLHRLSHNNVVREAAPLCLQRGLIEAAFAAGDSGALWMACEENAVTHVSEIRDGVAVSRQVTPYFTVAYRDREGTVWFGGPTALGHLDNGRVVTTPVPASIRGRPVQGLVRDGNGAMWVSVSRKGLFRFLNGEWSEYGNLAALPRAYPLVESADEGGTLWFGYQNNLLARVNGSLVRLFDGTQGLEVGNVLAILAQAGEVWVGGELGFARFDGARFVSIRNSSGTLRGVSGIVQSRNGDLWLNGTRGIVHVTRQEIERVLRDPSHPVKSETFDHLDGVRGMATQLRPQPSAIETTDGRIWFSTTVGIVSIDPTRLIRNTLPPPVTIWALNSGPVRYPNRGPELRLPVHTTDLQIEYSAGSLTVPERVHFRYKLEGSDRDWQDVGTRREAVYTNLGPGRYTFRVTAANNDGVWNDTGAAVGFTIAPAFYQTRWFYALCVLLFVAFLAGLYRIRVRQVAAQVRGRLEVRLAERERIARDLHDTLLQGMQGLILRFQAAADRLPPGEPARRLMEQTLDRADELLAEGRDKVKDLRPAADDVPDLPQALAAAGEQFAQWHPAKFRVSVQGTCRDLHPIAREEAFLIGREALGNAFRHAGADIIEAEVTYGDGALHLRIRDDGQGIGAAILDVGGRPGHFGLIGMRERAMKLGAHLEIWSKPGAGTEVDLRVPADVVYLHTGSGGRRSPLPNARSSVLES